MSVKKKLLLATAAVVLILGALIGFAAVRHIANSKEYLENQIGKYRDRMADAYAASPAEFDAAAKALLEIPAEDRVFFYFRLEDSPIPEPLQQELIALRDGSGVDFSYVYIGDYQVQYPANSCTFRCTILYSEGVYSWVDLVYSENWEAELARDDVQALVEEGVITPIVPNWCIVQLYGY